MRYNFGSKRSAIEFLYASMRRWSYCRKNDKSVNAIPFINPIGVLCNVKKIETGLQPFFKWKYMRTWLNLIFCCLLFLYLTLSDNFVTKYLNFIFCRFQFNHICDFCYKILGEFYPDFLSLSCIWDFYQDLRLMVKIYSFFTISFENFCQE